MLFLSPSIRSPMNYNSQNARGEGSRGSSSVKIECVMSPSEGPVLIVLLSTCHPQLIISSPIFAKSILT